MYEINQYALYGFSTYRMFFKEPFIVSFQNTLAYQTYQGPRSFVGVFLIWLCSSAENSKESYTVFCTSTIEPNLDTGSLEHFRYFYYVQKI